MFRSVEVDGFVIILDEPGCCLPLGVMAHGWCLVEGMSNGVRLCEHPIQHR